MNYEEAVAYIDETPKFTTKNKLEHTKECLRRLGNPQEKFRVIHVAGTNGKGSTCAFLTSILREAGYSCGLFTSPHLVEINERFQINEVNIDNDTFLRAFLKVKKLADELVAEGNYHPTYFEMLFLMGMVIFADAGVDYVTLETGLGGRLDATTAVENPAACVIASISFDHMQYLGNTIEEIAAEKAGIIVPGVPVIYDGNDPKAAEVIRKHAEKLGSPAYEVKREDAVIHRITRTGIDFSLNNEYYGDTVFQIPFVARYQVMNGSLALKTMEVLKDTIPASVETIQRGMMDTRWQGRMETVLPGVIVDGAHNEDGVAKFVETAAHFQEEYPLTLLFSAVDDKDYTDMIHTICDSIKFRNVVVTQVGGYRMVPAEVLRDIFRKEGYEDAMAFEEIPEAFDSAFAAKGEDGLLFCVGSLYLVGEIKSVIRERNRRKL
ncbi:MAG: folylpolyglutamate synthase/dihydrofolate synthase family protein [Blautia sp.]|nr:bifunctional folylpolyglutamate synthase/dihydrofolate synthase [Blautia sp.]MDY4000553.1 folylpolyglutamate synthase/dihydrofolate synthase family protein [Blautia sp.]